MGIRGFFEKLLSWGKREESGEREGNGNGGAPGAEGGLRRVCVDCKRPFIFEEGEQKFFKMRGLTPPKRCHGCRSRKRRR